MPRLPTELWQLIAYYLPKSQIQELKYLNSFFFCCAMDIDWGQVTIDTRKYDETVWAVWRMEDSFVQSRTKRLVLQFREPKFEAWRLSTVEETSKHLVSQILDVLPLLYNLTYLSVELIYFPTDLLSSLFKTITGLRTIEKLSLLGHPVALSSIVDYPSAFENLSALDLNLIERDNYNKPVIRYDIDSSSIKLANFISSFSHSLKVLRIWSLHDISHILSLLTRDGALPNLNTLLLLPHHYSFRNLNSPQPVNNFLSLHSTHIQHLQLVISDGCFPIFWNPEGDHRSSWLSKFVKDSHPSFFSNLRTLDISPPNTPAGLNATIAFVRRTASTLSSLRIRYELREEDAVRILDALKGKINSKTIKSLRLDTSHVMLSFIELVARKLPRLQKLHLGDKYLSSRTKEALMLSLEMSDSVALKSWKLQRFRLSDSAELLGALASAIPSLVGQDDDNEDDEDEDMKSTFF